MNKYRKKPVVVDAINWTGTEECLEEMLAFIDLVNLPDDGVHVGTGLGFTPTLGTLDIPTLEGVMTASPGDWIIKGVAGEFYPCKDSIFEATYEAVVSDDTVADDATRQEVDEDALNEDLDSLKDWESALRSTIRNQVTAGFNVTAQGDLADLLVRAHRWIAAAYLGESDK